MTAELCDSFWSVFHSCPVQSSMMEKSQPADVIEVSVRPIHRMRFACGHVFTKIGRRDGRADLVR